MRREDGHEWLVGKDLKETGEGLRQGTILVFA